MKQSVAVLVPIVVLLTVGCGCLFYQNINIQKQISDLQNQNSVLEEQLSDLQNALDVARDPNLSNWNNWLKTSLGVKDINSYPYPYPAVNTPAVVTRLFVQGYVWNTGNGTAYDCKLNVRLYQNGTLRYDVYLELGDISSGSSVYIEENIVYTGDSLSDWEIFPVFSNPSMN
jgi:hypothetical protein